ncbi:MAG: citrate/2-methylcitrate synthase, partial [Alphaproteobacteria bacterium]|nr:citrate/2-methylcitrate synthase [Alphaproteobacteria bacterium]
AAAGRILVRGFAAEELIEKLDFAETTYLIIRGELPTPVQARALDAALRSGLDQAFINSAVPPARFAASAAPEAPAAAIAAGVIAFGSVTGSPAQCAGMLAEGYRDMTADGLDPAQAAGRIIDAYRQAGERIPGLGHPMHKKAEPRARALSAVARELGVWGPRAELLDALEAVAAERLGRPLPVNLAGVMAAVLLEIGFEPLEMVGLAIMAYLPSLVAHTVEEIREGVPLRIIPEELGAHYAGPAERPLPEGYGSNHGPANESNMAKEDKT